MSTQRDLILHLEVLLERAKKGEVQMYIGSCAFLPLTVEGWGEMRVEGYAAFGSLVHRLDKESLKGVYAKTLEGLSGSAEQANAAFEKLVERFDAPEEP